MYTASLQNGRTMNAGLPLAALVLLGAVSTASGQAPASPNRSAYLYQGADRDQRLAEGAKKEGQVVLYSTMTVST
jgi:hypothetical protein